MAIFLKFEGDKIKGTSKTKGFEGQIEVMSVQWGCGRGISVSASSQREPSRASVSEITFTKDSDIASPEIFIQACVGKHLGKATVTWTGSGGNSSEVFQVLELNFAMISSYSQSSGGDNPTESFSINFDLINFKRTGVTYDGKPASPNKIFNLATGEGS